jgi:hypothetical protein
MASIELLHPKWGTGQGCWSSSSGLGVLDPILHFRLQLPPSEKIIWAEGKGWLGKEGMEEAGQCREQRVPR